MKILGKLLLFVLILSLIFVVVLGGFGFLKYKSTISTLSIEDATHEIQSRPGFVHLKDLPQIYKDGVVAVEDHRFYSHPGFDPIAMIRAIKNDIKARSFVEGGSTITQQLVKNIYFNHDKSIMRKVAELLIAIQMERNFTKEEILELYVNCIYFGRECYGIADASRVYFNKYPWELNDYEATLLVGIPNGPKYYDPSFNPKGAVKRHRRVINDLIRRNYITKEKGKDILGDEWSESKTGMELSTPVF
ncbi:MAG: biosynthetic peptidoglycan transglycosylase [Tissierellia bacterium]|nr:biosynthetic peptidoglycan transglycosylase [Tissierellia bacterium]